jgi:archaellum component FlaG (FlaF/FlaG flagellin family)
LEKAIATVILTVAGITAIVAVVNALMPAISRTSGSLVASADSVDSRISTQVEIIHAAGADGSGTVETWTKNVGALEISPIDRVDVFFGTADNFLRIPYGGPSCTAPCWDYTIENDSVWNPTATLRVTLTLDYTLSAGNTYYIKVVAPNGINDARFFTV